MKQLIKRIKNNKFLSITGILIIGLILVLIFRITYAFFAPVINEALGNVVVDSATVDKFSFNLGDALKVDATPTTLPETGTNLVKSTTATASLTANSTKNTATMNYYVYFQIPENNFVYSDGSTPEIILTIKNPNGTEVTNISGLTYGTFNGVSGFDITTYSGLITVANNYEITSKSSKEATNQEWQFTVTYLNLSIDQSGNYGHSMSTKVIMSKEERVLAYHDTCNESLLACHVAKQYTGTQGDNNMYYHDNSLTNGAKDNSYRYAGPSETTNNFVCFGYDSTDGTCPTDYLYRIIGVFNDQVKLIKYDFVTSTLLGTDGEYTSSTYSKSNYSTYKGELTTINKYYWNNSNGDSSTNTWSASRLNTINLNTNYLNNIGTNWANKIATHTWKVGGNTYANIASATAPNVYTNEITSPAENTPYDAKIGLMYVSDYGYAASPSAWTTAIKSYNSSSVTSVNWIYMGMFEWTIARSSDGSGGSFVVGNNGFVGEIGVSNSYAIRPVIYLESSVSYASGNGRASTPFIIK
ncbi:hypothetical protein EGR52_12710 [bacterium]|nr:hypothetical protein [bacterium]